MRSLQHLRVLIVGVGGLGTVIARELALAQRCTIGLIDGDRVTHDNAYRQLLYTRRDIGKKKVIAARARLHEMRPRTEVEIFDCFLTNANARSMISSYDVVVDAADNALAEFLMNDECVRSKKPFLYGAIHGLRGQIALFNVRQQSTASRPTNLRDVFPTSASYSRFTPRTTGPIAIVTGSMMASEIIRFASGKPLHFVDALCEVNLKLPQIRLFRLRPIVDNA